MPPGARYLTQAAIAHIVLGEWTPTSQRLQTGFHVWQQALEAQRDGRLVLESVEILPNGVRRVYLSNARAGWVKKTKHTFFPENWTQAEIMEAIEAVANDPAGSVSTERTDQIAVFSRHRGVRIEVLIKKSSGEIISGYPVWLQQ